MSSPSISLLPPPTKTSAVSDSFRKKFSLAGSKIAVTSASILVAESPLTAGSSSAAASVTAASVAAASVTAAGSASVSSEASALTVC